MQPTIPLIMPALSLESNEEFLLLARPQILDLGYGQVFKKIIKKKQSHKPFHIFPPLSVPPLRWWGRQKLCRLLGKLRALCLAHYITPTRKIKLRICQCLIRRLAQKELISPGSPQLRVAMWRIGSCPPTNPSSCSATGHLVSPNQWPWLWTLLLPYTVLILPGSGNTLSP